MSGRHRARPSRSNLVIGSIAASVGVSSVLAAAVVELVSHEPSTAATRPLQPQPVTEQGTVIALTPDSLTTQRPDGVTQTYAITPNTNAVTSLAVNDEVTVVGTRQGGTAVATAVADSGAVGPAGRPMDFGL